MNFYETKQNQCYQYCLKKKLIANCLTDHNFFLSHFALRLDLFEKPTKIDKKIKSC